MPTVPEPLRRNAYSLYADIDETGVKVTTILPYLLLFVSLMIAPSPTFAPSACR